MIHIAIVDDEQKQRDLLCGYLERYRQESGRQLRVTAFADAETFLQGYQPDFDIIFMDIQLPDRDGMTLSKKLRETNRTVILIFVTNMVQMAVEGYSVDAMDFIVKPVNYYRMAAALDSLKKLEQQLEGQGFARCNSGYLVGLRYVRAVTEETVEVNGEPLRISRTRRKEFLRQLSDYLGRGG